MTIIVPFPPGDLPQGFIRHRDRMVQESVREDLVNTLIACRWMAGTTSRRVISPYDVASGRQIVTTATNQVLRMVGKTKADVLAQVQVIDFFPESGGAGQDKESRVGNPEQNQTPPNTLAIDDGQRGEPQRMELGSNMIEQPYNFTMAFWANSDSVAKALLNDLGDRYLGRIVEGDCINLYDYNTDPDTVVVRMEVDSFRYNRNLDSATPQNVHLYFAELQLTDFVPE